MDSRREGYSCRVFPWIPLFCIAILAVGSPLWVIFSGSAADSTREALTAAQFYDSTTEQLLGLVNLVRVVVLALLVAAAVFVVVMSVLHMIRQAGDVKGGGGRPGVAGARPPALRALLAADGFTTLLLWVLLLGTVALLALYASWMLGLTVTDLVLSRAAQYSDTAEQAATRALGSANTLIDKLRQTQIDALDKAPDEVKNSQWFKDFRNGVQNFNQTISIVAGTPSSDSCKKGCISLEFFAGLAGLNSTCICVKHTITTLQQGLRVTEEAILRALIGMLLLYLASSWLVMYFTSRCTHGKRDLRDHRRMVKSSSSGEGFKGYSTSGIPLGADAAIDIRAAADSPLGIEAQLSRPVPRSMPMAYPQPYGAGGNGGRLPHV